MSRWERVLVIGDSWANDNGDYPKWVTAAPIMCEGTSNWTNCDRNEAVAGRRVDEMRTNLTSMLAAHPTIDSVIINGGTNDFSAGRTAFNVFLDMQAIIQEVQTQPNIRDMIVINCPPIKGNAGYTAAKQAEIDTYNSDGTENLEALGVWIVDVYGLVEGTGAEEDTIRFEYGQSYPADPRTDWIHINQDTARDVLAPLIDATILQAKAGAPWRGQLTAYETALALSTLLHFKGLLFINLCEFSQNEKY